jgi:TPR repeat protein
MQGLAPAQYDFGIMNELGDGIKQDKSKAAYWYRKAAEQGDERAKEILEELNRPTSVTDEDDEFFDIFNELMDTDDQSLVTLVEKKENSEHGPFVNINNDLASFIEINEDCSDLIKMAYGYARRYAAAGMYAQGIIDNSSYNHVYSMFQGLQLKTRDGDGDSKEFQIKAARQAIEYMISYSKELDVQIIQFTLHIVENGLDSPLSRGETYDFNQVIAVLKELKSRLYPIS